jgi:gliding motility-associated-like protein
MKFLSTRWLQLPLALLFLFSSVSLFADHLSGGEIRYKCTGQGSYQIYLYVFADCDGTALANSAEVTLKVANSSTFSTITGVLDSSYFEGPANPNTCQMPSESACRQVGIYKFDANLPYSFGGYHVFYNSCCRNTSQQNLDISDPNAETSLLHTLINMSAYYVCNQSVESDLISAMTLCVNEPFSFDFNAADAEGDSLAYHLCPPKNGQLGGQGTAFPSFAYYPFLEPAFGLNNMLGSTSPMTMNATTGQVAGTAAAAGTYTVAFCIDEYREGALLCSTVKEFQIVVSDCETAQAEFVVAPSQCVETGGEVFVTAPENLIGLPMIWNITNTSGSFNETYTDFSFSFAPPATGVYTVEMILYPGENCETTATQTISITTTTTSIGTLTLANLSCTGGNASQTITVPTATTGNPSLVSYTLIANGPDGQVLNLGQNPTYQIPLTHGTWDYFLVVTLTDGCILTTSATQSYNVPEVFIPQLQTGPQPVCYSSNCLNIPASLGYNNYAWLVTDVAGATVTTSTNDTLSLCEEGDLTIRLIVTNQAGCKDTVTTSSEFFNVTNFPNPQIAVANCINDVFPQTITLSNNLPTAADVSTWSLEVTYPDFTTQTFAEQTTTTINTVLGGVYTYVQTVEYTNGCIVEKVVSSDVFALPQAVILTPELQCNFTLGTMISDGQQGFLYNWSIINEAGAIINTSSQASYTFNFPGTGNYTLQLVANSPGNGCPDTATQQLEVLLLNPADIPPLSAPVCVNGVQQQGIIVPAALLTEYGFESWSWTAQPPSGSAIVFDNIGSATVNITQDGSWSFIFTGEAAPGCVLQGFQFADYNPITFFPPTQVPFCAQDTVYLNPNAGSEPDNNYTWTPANLINNPSDSNPYVLYSEVGNQPIGITITNTAGCTYNGTVNLYAPNPPLAFDFQTATTGCVLPIPITAVGNAPVADVIWSTDPNFGSALAFGQAITLDEFTPFPLYVQGNFTGCIIVDTLLGPPYEVPEVSLTFTLPDCQNPNTSLVTATLISGDPNELGWQLYPDSIQSEIISITQIEFFLTDMATPISFLATNEEGCSDTATIFLPTALLLPWSLDVTATPTQIELGQTSQLNTVISGTPVGTLTYFWMPANTLSDPTGANPVATPTQTTTYGVEVTDGSGCSLQDTVTVEIITIAYCDAPFTQFTNAFTPNNDAVNDTWNIVDPQYIGICEIIVFDRWGAEVFKSTDPNFAWNGQANSMPLPSDNYLYTAKLTCLDGVTKEIAGEVAIIR